MRLFLHGRSKASMLIQKLEMACRKIDNNDTQQTAYSSLLLSNWNLDQIPQDVLEALEVFLAQGDVPKDIVLQNCTSDHDPERLERLVEILMNAAASPQQSTKRSSLTIRYDKQRKFPLAVARGLLQGAEKSQSGSLHALILKGMTFTAEAVALLQDALLLQLSLQELTIRGNFILQKLDRRGSSIVGRPFSSNPDHLEETECIVDILYDILKGLPDLKHFDLQRCHIPDQYLADLMEGLYPETLQVLRLNGNMCGEETQEMLYDMLSHEQSALQELDLSWQRQAKASKNCSFMPLSKLSLALANGNASLQKLNLSDNRLADQDIAEMAVALGRNKGLQSLWLQNCQISTRGILALAQTLPHWPEQLKSVYIDGQQRVEKSSKTRRKLFQALLENVYLQNLELPDTCQSKRMAWVLDLNRAGRRVLLNPSELEEIDAKSNSSSSESESSLSSTDQAVLQAALWPTVLERADRVSRQECFLEESCTTRAASTIFLLLREKGYQSCVR